MHNWRVSELRFTFPWPLSLLKITQLALTRGTWGARLFGSDDNLSLPVSPPKLYPSCFMPVKPIFIVLPSEPWGLHNTYWAGEVRGSSQRPKRGGGFCMEPSLHPILHPGSDRVAEHTAHVWAHTKSASKRVGGLVGGFGWGGGRVGGGQRIAFLQIAWMQPSPSG